MLILGLHGWDKREHDPLACLIKDGKILAMAEEERFIRVKHAFDHLPINAASYCLKQANITLDQIDMVALGYDRKKLYDLRNIDFKLTSKEILELLLPPKYFSYSKAPILRMVDHHLSHAASAYYTSGFKEAAILVVDGQGEDCSTSLGYAKDGKIKIFKKLFIDNSLGYFYEAVGKFIGFGLHDAGKVMGLASYGKPNKFKFRNFKVSNQGYQISFDGPIKLFSKKEEEIDEQKVMITAWFKYLEKSFKILPRENIYTYNYKNSLLEKTLLNLTQRDKDLAASLQDQVERIVFHLCRLLKEKTCSENLLISGGVGLNCSLNGKINSSKIFKNVYIFPAANDAGVSAGAALYISALYDKKARFTKLDHIYLGPGYTNYQIRKILDDRKLGYKISNNICKETAQLLAKGKIIGWFQGKMEVGPRALGNRSILASPLGKSMRKKVDITKGRELWRPLAPSILNGYKDEYFENAQYSPFMLKTFQVKKDKQSLIPAVVHIDGSTRPQTVSKKVNKRFWLLINEFRKITGVPMLLNTSFNFQNEPIVCSPLNALKTFFSTSLDYLVLGDYLIRKDD